MKQIQISFLLLLLTLFAACQDNQKNVEVSYKNEIIGINTNNDFQAYNSNGKQILKISTSDFERYDIVADKLAYLDKFGRFTLIDSEGNVLIKREGVNKFQLTARMVSTIGYNRRIQIQNIDGKNLTIRDADSFTQSDTMIAYRKYFNGQNQLTITDLEGKELFSTLGNNSVKLSNNFIAINDSMSFQIFNNKGEELVSTNGVVDFKVTDTFASYTDNIGYTTIINKDGDVIMSEYEIQDFKITNSFIVFKKIGNLYIFDENGNIIFSELEPKSYQIYNNVIAIKNNANILQLVNKYGQIVHWSAHVDSYGISNTSLVYKSGTFLSLVNLNGKLLKNINVLDMKYYEISDSMIAVQNKVGNLLEVYNAQTGAEIISQMNVRRYKMSRSPEEFTWSKF